ncbi:hypothetical protein N7448_000692 [Penicillium atrosanguineum]|uniref:Uncharacterized protein n=1 Tax=Penicillium atrosanguineum TaxID=1132637 RepID=A0A9W9LCW1_9EURO|nr:hypothetical protein N7448_000692 [Penicillium atrosanguineum]KAJ5323900.1 hypothetical protein N7476_002500 [Penicillium atrosanguineum]
MTSGLPYLKSLRKPDLVDFAERTDLQEYEDFNKNDLAIALDKHLSDNSSIFMTDSKLSKFYERLGVATPRKTPAKRTSEAKVEISPVKKTPGRKPKTKVESEPSSDESSKPAITKPTRTPSSVRTPRASFDVPASPALVAASIDRQTAKMREGLENAWDHSGFLEHSYSVRAMLSSLKAVETILICLEGSSVIKSLFPMRHLANTPAVDAIHLPEIMIKVPDVFVMITGEFWASLTLWALTSVVLPLIAAWFINLSWMAATGGQSVRRTRSASTRASFDPLTFNIAKALLVYKVFVEHFNYFDLFSNYTIVKVNAVVPGRWKGMLTGTAIGVIGTLYEAILRRS